jgi:Icc-related predicted phosphoesterase
VTSGIENERSVSDRTQPPAADSVTVRIAAAGDLHVRETDAGRVGRSLRALQNQSDLILLAGDLTTYGEPAQARALVEACRSVEVPVLAVLGNHDCHSDRHRELVELLSDGGIRVLEREHVVVATPAGEVGIVGLKGFIGGFAGSHLPDFGEPLLRRCYDVTTADVEALHRGLREIALCPVRVVLLHYAPTADTLHGEPEGIWTMLGSERLAAPIAEHEPDLVLHGHAHAGTFEGRIGQVPVYNVAVQVMGRDFWVFELSAGPEGTSRLR